MADVRLPDPSRFERPWVETYPPGVPVSYQVPTIGLPRILDDAVRDFPEHTALVAGDARIDHATLRDRVEDLAAALHLRGVDAGDRVLVVLPNLLTLPIVLLATWRLRAIAVPLEPSVGTERLARIVDDARPTAIVASRRVQRSLGEQRPPVGLLVDDDRWVIATRTRRRSWWPWRRAGRTEPSAPPIERPTPGSVRLDEAVHEARQRGSQRPVFPVPSGAPALLAYRDGDPPLGLMFTHQHLVAATFQARLWVPDVQAGREIALVTEPLARLDALVVGWLAGLLAATSVVLLDAPDGDRVARSVERERPTLLLATADRLRTVLTDGEAAKRDLTSLRVVLTCGPSPTPGSRAELSRRTGGARARTTFRPAEAAGPTHAQPVYGLTTERSAGPPVTDTLAAVVDPDALGTVRPAGTPGRLLVRGPQVATDVWGRRHDPHLVDGWGVTDHIGTVDEHGAFTPIGRLGEVERLGDTWVAPARIEAALEAHAAVRRAGVVVDHVAGRVRAAVVCRRRPRPTTDELVAHCRTHLDPPAVPADIHLVDDLPEDEAGAIKRDELRERLVGKDTT